MRAHANMCNTCKSNLFFLFDVFPVFCVLVCFENMCKSLIKCDEAQVFNFKHA